MTRLCAMNLMLHGIGGDSDADLPVVTKDALAGRHGEYNVVLANPPFGKKSSVTIVNEVTETKSSIKAWSPQPRALLHMPFIETAWQCATSCGTAPLGVGTLGQTRAAIGAPLRQP